MPEPYWPKHKGRFSLSASQQLGQVIRIECRYCKIVRHYLPHDLRLVFGDVEVDAIMGRMRCEKCRKVETIVVDGVFLSAEARQNMVFRRLKSVVYVPRVTWRDGPG